MNCTKQADKAGSRVFTLIWLTTAASTAGRLLSLALPAFQRYANRARFSEAIVTTSPLKASIEIAVFREIINDINNK